MILISSKNKEFPYEDSKYLYESNRKYFKQTGHIPFDELYKICKGNLWAVLVDGKVSGLMHFCCRDEKWFLSGCSRRKMFNHVSKAINIICEHYCKYLKIYEIFAETSHLHASLALKRAGFKKTDKELFRKVINV